MYAAGVVTSDNVASIDIPEDGNIVGIDWTMVPGVGTGTFNGTDDIRVQLSFLSTSQFAQNDARAVISSVGMGVGALTGSGLGSVYVNKTIAFHEALDVAAGERLYLHAAENGAAGYEVSCHIHLQIRAKAQRRRTRRR